MNERRFAAALASCQHAVEKAIKAVLYVELGAGNFQLRHDMSAELGLSSRLVLSMREFNRLQELENLLPPSPRRPIRRNTEYPWVYLLRPTRVYHPHTQVPLAPKYRAFSEVMHPDSGTRTVVLP